MNNRISEPSYSSWQEFAGRADVTLGFMAKIKPAARKKPALSHLGKPGVTGGLGCVILVVSLVLLVFLLLYYSIARA